MVLIRCLTIAANLGIADLVADEPKSVDDLSNSVGADPLTLYRILRRLASYGYFAEDEEGRFGLTPTAEYLRSDQENSMRDYLQLIGARWFWDSLANLPHTVETGEPAFEQAYNIELFNYLSDTVHRILAKSFDFGRYNRIVDIGGGQGAFLAAILSEYPAVRGVLLDNPSVVANQEYLRKMGVTCSGSGISWSGSVRLIWAKALSRRLLSGQKTASFRWLRIRLPWWPGARSTAFWVRKNHRFGMTRKPRKKTGPEGVA